jgi:opacity protein-like surface antigen
MIGLRAVDCEQYGMEMLPLMSFQKSLLASAVLVCGTAGVASAQELCSASDASYEISSDCNYTSWSAFVIIRYNGNSWSDYFGWFGGGAVCDTGGVNCDGSSRPFRLYESTKQFQSWGQWDPDHPYVRVW